MCSETRCYLSEIYLKAKLFRSVGPQTVKAQAKELSLAIPLTWSESKSSSKIKIPSLQAIARGKREKQAKTVEKNMVLNSAKHVEEVCFNGGKSHFGKCCQI